MFLKRLENIKLDKRYVLKKIGNIKLDKRDVHKMIEKHKVGDDKNRRKTLKIIRVRGTRLIDRITCDRNSGAVKVR